MKWAPEAVRSHLMEYLLELENTSQALFQHSGLALATESVLNYAGYHSNAAALGVCSTRSLTHTDQYLFDVMSRSFVITSSFITQLCLLCPRIMYDLHYMMLADLRILQVFI